MTGDEFKAARRALGLSLRQLAEAIGWSGDSARHMRRFERDGVGGAVAARVRQLLGAKKGGEGQPPPPSPAS